MSDFDTNYIADLLRREDRDRYLTTLLAPARVRVDLMILYAFAAETARIRGQVSEALIGRVKLQWWMDVIAAIYEGKGAPKGNPLTQGLASIIQRHSLTRAHFETLLTTRTRDMVTEDESAMRTAADVEAYAEGTAAPLTWLALEILGARDAAAQEAGRHAGVAYALTGILRALPAELTHNRLFFAQAATGTDQAAIAALARDLSATAAHRLALARAQNVSRAAIPALLPASIAGRYLAQVIKRGSDIFDPRVAHGRTSIVALIWDSLRGKF